MTATAGKSPPSVPICTNDGPAVAGSGTPPFLPSVGQVAGKPAVLTAGTIFTSQPGATPAGQATVVSARNKDRLRVRSLPALRIWKRYGAASTCSTGYAVPFTTGVSMNASGVPEGLGVIGHCIVTPG